MREAVLSISLFLSLLAAGGACGAAPKEAPKPFPVADVVSEVKRELLAAQKDQGAALGLTLDKVELAFSVTRTTDANGKVSVGIPAFGAEIGGGGGRKGEEASSLTVELVPPSPSITMSRSEGGSLGIADAIINTRRELLKGLNDEPKLDPRKVQIVLKFAVTRSGGPTGQIKFLIFTVGGGATFSAAETNSITLTFSKAKAP